MQAPCRSPCTAGRTPSRAAPVAYSFHPDAAGQRFTFTSGDTVYEAESKELQIQAPDDVKLDPLRNLLCWAGDKGPIKSTAREVFDLARSRASGFRIRR